MGRPFFTSQIRISKSRNYSLDALAHAYAPAVSFGSDTKAKEKSRHQTAVVPLFSLLPYRLRLRRRRRLRLRLLSFIPIRFFLLPSLSPFSSFAAAAAIDSLELEMTRFFFFFFLFLLHSSVRVGSRRLKDRSLCVCHTQSHTRRCVCANSFSSPIPKASRFGDQIGSDRMRIKSSFDY